MKIFKVKSGKNKGIYLVFNSSKVDGEREQIIRKSHSWGLLDPINDYDFFKRHGIKQSQSVWTHTKFASMEFWEEHLPI